MSCCGNSEPATVRVFVSRMPWQGSRFAGDCAECRNARYAPASGYWNPAGTNGTPAGPRAQVNTTGTLGTPGTPGAASKGPGGMGPLSPTELALGLGQTGAATFGMAFSEGQQTERARIAAASLARQQEIEAQRRLEEVQLQARAAMELERLRQNAPQQFQVMPTGLTTGGGVTERTDGAGDSAMNTALKVLVPLGVLGAIWFAMKGGR